MVGHVYDIFVELGLGGEGENGLHLVAVFGIKIAEISNADAVLTVVVLEDGDFVTLVIYFLVDPILVAFAEPHEDGYEQFLCLVAADSVDHGIAYRVQAHLLRFGSENSRKRLDVIADGHRGSSRTEATVVEVSAEVAAGFTLTSGAGDLWSIDAWVYPPEFLHNLLTWEAHEQRCVLRVTGIGVDAASERLQDRFVAVFNSGVVPPDNLT